MPSVATISQLSLSMNASVATISQLSLSFVVRGGGGVVNMVKKKKLKISLLANSRFNFVR